MITVAIPVGPNPGNRRYLKECLESVEAQTHKASEVLIIDDQAGLPDSPFAFPGIRIWKTPWLSGVAHAFNFGVALASNDLVLMLGSDDRLEPHCLADCARTWEKFKDPLGYYYLDLQYSTGEQQSLACNAAMVHKALWRHTGGFPVESAVGAPDTVLISVMLANRGKAGNLRHVASKTPPYWYRVHDETDTIARAKPFYSAIKVVRDVYTASWNPPQWPTISS